MINNYIESSPNQDELEEVYRQRKELEYIIALCEEVSIEVEVIYVRIGGVLRAVISIPTEKKDNIDDQAVNVRKPIYDD